MSPADEVASALLHIDTSDPETAHSQADALILDFLPEDVRRAYMTVAKRCRWWAFA